MKRNPDAIKSLVWSILPLFLIGAAVFSVQCLGAETTVPKATGRDIDAPVAKRLTAQYSVNLRCTRLYGEFFYAEIEVAIKALVEKLPYGDKEVTQIWKYNESGKYMIRLMTAGGWYVDLKQSAKGEMQVTGFGAIRVD